VKDIMTDDIAITRASITAREAIEIFRNRSVPILVVYLESEPAFALTEYDLAIAIAQGHGDSVALYELIKKRVAIRCCEDAILADAIDAMLNHRARQVPVVDTKGDLVGLLSLVEAVGALTPEAAAFWQAKVRQLWTMD
jgi:CBS domain-containing protein